MAEASMVLSTCNNEVRVWHNKGEKKVRMEFGDVTIFIEPDAAHGIGAQMIAIAATISTAYRPELLNDTEPVVAVT